MSVEKQKYFTSKRPSYAIDRESYDTRDGYRFEESQAVRHDARLDARHDARYDARHDTRYDTRHDTRYDTRYDARYDARLDARYDEREPLRGNTRDPLRPPLRKYQHACESLHPKQSFLFKLGEACKHYMIIMKCSTHSINFEESYVLYSKDPSLFMLMACKYFISIDIPELRTSDYILQKLMSYKPKTQQALKALYMLSTKMYPLDHINPKHKESLDDYDTHLTNFFDSLDDLLDYLKALSETVLQTRKLLSSLVDTDNSEILSKMKVGKDVNLDIKNKMIDFHRQVYQDALQLIDFRLPRKIADIDDNFEYLLSFMQSDGTYIPSTLAKIEKVEREKSDLYLWYERQAELLDKISKTKLPIDFGYNQALDVWFN